MSQPPPAFSKPAAAPTREEILAALFANMVIQQTNMAMMMLGKVADPGTGQYFEDPESAKMFIEQLEMLAVKTKGNLTRQEDALLKQGLTALRQAYAQLVGPAAAADLAKLTVEAEAAPAPALPAVAATGPAAAPATAGPSPEPVKAVPVPMIEENKKKFTKKY